MFCLKSDPKTVTNYPSTDKLQENSSHKVDRKRDSQVKFIGNATKGKSDNFLKIGMKIISTSIKSQRSYFMSMNSIPAYFIKSEAHIS